MAHLRVALLPRRCTDIQANRVTDKLTHIHDRIYCCRSGSAADTQAVADVVHHHAQVYTQVYGESPPVATIAALFEKMCYDNKDQLSAGIIVGGWDKEKGGSVYNIPLGGGIFQQPWAIGGEDFIGSLSDRQVLDQHMSMGTATRRIKKGGMRPRPLSL